MVASASSRDTERFRRLDAAFRVGDLVALRRDLGGADNFPDTIGDLAIGPCLTYAIVERLTPITTRQNWGRGAPGFDGKIAADLAVERGDRRLAAFIRANGRTPTDADSKS